MKFFRLHITSIWIFWTCSLYNVQKINVWEANEWLRLHIHTWNYCKLLRTPNALPFSCGNQRYMYISRQVLLYFSDKKLFLSLVNYQVYKIYQSRENVANDQIQDLQLNVRMLHMQLGQYSNPSHFSPARIFQPWKSKATCKIPIFPIPGSC